MRFFSSNFQPQCYLIIYATVKIEPLSCSVHQINFLIFWHFRFPIWQWLKTTSKPFGTWIKMENWTWQSSLLACTRTPWFNKVNGNPKKTWPDFPGFFVVWKIKCIWDFEDKKNVSFVHPLQLNHHEAEPRPMVGILVGRVFAVKSGRFYP